MTFIFIPIIFDKYIDIRNAQISRGLDSRKRTIKMLVYTTRSLLTSIIRQSDEMAYAMEARNYTEDSSIIIFDKLKVFDVIMLVCSLLVVGVALYISYVLY